jgi:predicted Rossmann fold nucleotide-binding protein DprA/Smf involved in DNA uptake
MPALYRIGAPLGAVLGRCPIAVAGTRDPTPWGARTAREVGRRLAERGRTVVTGFARGVDEEAALGALEAADVVKAFEYFMQRGAVAAEGVDEALGLAERACRAPYMFKNS